MPQKISHYTNFSALKYVQAEMLFNFQQPVTRLLPMTSQ